jgi:NTP pyrophosphatase (non-canonical NTP hydrolase)
MLMEYIEEIHHLTPSLTVKKPLSQTEHILSALSCLTEEVGELSAEIRKQTKCSFSQKKVDAFSPEDLKDEACDVLITLLLLLKSLDIDDLWQALERKVQKNKDRGY